jgi:hypothetical protein
MGNDLLLFWERVRTRLIANKRRADAAGKTEAYWRLIPYSPMTEIALTVGAIGLILLWHPYRKQDT